jgi:hypothetical protein
VLVSIFVTLPSRIYKGGQGPLSKQKRSLGHSTPKGIQITIQDVGCYAPCGPNLSKSCVPCTFEFLISASPHPKLTTLGISLGGQLVKHRQLARQVGESVEDPPASSMASFNFIRSVPSQGTTFVFGSWVCIADGVGNFRRFLVDLRPKTFAADLRGDLDKFLMSSTTCRSMPPQHRLRWSLLQSRLPLMLRQHLLVWTRSNLGICTAGLNSALANWPLIFRRPTSLGLSPC